MTTPYTPEAFSAASVGRQCLFIDGGLKGMGNICGAERAVGSAYCPVHHRACYIERVKK